VVIVITIAIGLVEFDFGVESTDARHKMARTNHLLD
jgi:hypothetical protein